MATGPTPAQIAAFNTNLAQVNSGIPNNGLPSGYSATSISTTNPDGATAPTSSVNPGATGGSTTPSGPTAAQLAAQANYNNLKTSDLNAINSSIGSNASGYNQGILDAFNGTNGFATQQDTINANSTQNELSKLSGMQGVRDMVNNGIQGGGVVLDNDNAGTSSAADALARAYGVMGRQQASSVGRQYAEGQNTIGNSQNALTRAENNFVNVDSPAIKQSKINDIVQAATQSLTYLNLVAGQTADPTQLGDINTMIANIKAQATSALTAYDGTLATQMSTNTPASLEDNQAKASGLFSSGTAPTTEFNFTNEAPATLQGTGPSASSLPIFLNQSQKNNIPATA